MFVIKTLKEYYNIQTYWATLLTAHYYEKEKKAIVSSFY